MSRFQSNVRNPFWVVSWFESILVKPLWVMSWVESKLSETELYRFKKIVIPMGGRCVVGIWTDNRWIFSNGPKNSTYLKVLAPDQCWDRLEKNEMNDAFPCIYYVLGADSGIMWTEMMITWYLTLQSADSLRTSSALIGLQISGKYVVSRMLNISVVRLSNIQRLHIKAPTTRLRTQPTATEFLHSFYDVLACLSGSSQDLTLRRAVFYKHK